jgi:hypothetical protein
VHHPSTLVHWWVLVHSGHNNSRIWSYMIISLWLTLPIWQLANHNSKLFLMFMLNWHNAYDFVTFYVAIGIISEWHLGNFQYKGANMFFPILFWV